MIEIRCSKILSYIVNAILLLYQLPQVLTGLIGLAIFHNVKLYKNPYNSITVFSVTIPPMFGRACFSSGPFIFVCEGATDRTYLHETGHSQQSIYLGFLFHFVVSIPSICRFWYRKIMGKSKAWYESGYPEKWANQLGGVDNLTNGVYLKVTK